MTNATPSRTAAATKSPKTNAPVSAWVYPSVAVSMAKYTASPTWETIRPIDQNMRPLGTL